MRKIYRPKKKYHLKRLCHNPKIHLSEIDTSLIVDMSGLFEGFDGSSEEKSRNFDGIETWEMDNVCNLSNMFYESNFNHPIESWSVGNARNMAGMFSHTPFNQPLDSWDVSNVRDMYAMFRNSEFDQSLSSWDVSNVENMDEMFANSKFNHSLDSWKLLAMREKPKDMFLNSAFQGSLEFFSTITPKQCQTYYLEKKWSKKLHSLFYKNMKRIL